MRTVVKLDHGDNIHRPIVAERKIYVVTCNHVPEARLPCLLGASHEVSKSRFEGHVVSPSDGEQEDSIKSGFSLGEKRPSPAIGQLSSLAISSITLASSETTLCHAPVMEAKAVLSPIDTHNHRKTCRERATTRLLRNIENVRGPKPRYDLPHYASRSGRQPAETSLMSAASGLAFLTRLPDRFRVC